MMNATDRATVVGVFEEKSNADRAIQALRDAGFRDDQIGLAMRQDSSLRDKDITTPGEADETKEDTGQGSHTGTGALTGMLTGLGLGALAGLGVLSGFIPVIGPAIAGGTLGIILSNAAAGAGLAGLVGALVGAGVPEEEASYYQGEFEAGRTIVTVTADGRRDEAMSILRRFGAYDVSRRGETDARGASASTSETMGSETGEVGAADLGAYGTETPIHGTEVPTHGVGASHAGTSVHGRAASDVGFSDFGTSTGDQGTIEHSRGAIEVEAEDFGAAARDVDTILSPRAASDVGTIEHGRGTSDVGTPNYTKGAGDVETSDIATRGTQPEQHVQLKEEQLEAEKRPVEAGEVRLRKEAHTEHQTIEVPVQREEVVIERKPGHGQPVSEAQGGDLDEGKEIRVPVRHEKVEVTKTPVVTEEVTVGKRTVEDTERVEGEVR
ncbi:MAG: YsnF/AvaK domain-containing protein, partial [Planctomycetaceae bacterium]|nr:YsnF/AvaK domain-containing protein [Planctomycetaceae bacterium]